MNYFNDIFLINEERNFGFSFLDKRIKFLIPEMLLPKDKNYFYFMKKYNSILKKYSHSQIKKIEYLSSNNLKENDILNLEIISSYINLLDDYFSNNEFLLFEKYYHKDNKKIKWSKTLKENDLIFSKNNIIYNSFISENKRINSYHNYYLLYKEALRKSKEIFLGTSEEEFLYPKTKNEQHYYLYQYGENHFKDREIFINRNLINIFLNENLNNFNEKIFEIKYHTKFEFIWQHMIETIISKYKYKVKINSGKYIEKNKIGLLLFQDHFIDYNQHYYLLDSKFYKSYYNENYPDTSSIAKQYMYHHLISQQHKINPDNITNFFIFPKNNPNNTQPELFDTHTWEDNKYLTIYCIALDINLVIDLYLKNSVYYEFITFMEKVKNTI